MGFGVSPMESSSALFKLSSPPSFLKPKPNNIKNLPPKPWNHTTSKPTYVQCNKMFVPGDNRFGEASPEAKAAQNLHQFFTYTAVKIVSAQLESYNPEAHKDLMEFLDTHSLNDGDKFCADLMRKSPRHKGLALRILEVRSAYCKNDFEWDNLKRLAEQMVNESNTKLMRDYVQETSH
ncbi:Chaperonin-like RBCX protein 1 chloroplastic [Bienertia sinuspersici]